MKHSHRIRLLKDRLHRLETNGRDNYGICRKIRREIESLKTDNTEQSAVIERLQNELSESQKAQILPSANKDISWTSRIR